MVKPHSKYARNRTRRNGIGTYCKSCMSAYNRGDIASFSTRDPQSIEIDERTIPYGTPRQQKAALALIAHGTIESAAASCGVTAKTLREHLRCLKQRAARRGWSPAHDLDKPVPDTHYVKGVSTYYGVGGDKRGQWVKTEIEKEHRATILLDACKSAMESHEGASKFIPEPDTVEDLLCVYPMGDPHIGMYAWAAESGDDFDVTIACRDLYTAVDKLVAISPPAAIALLLNLGDFFHADTKDARTARAGNMLDVDTRWARVLDIGIRIMIRLIDRLLEKHAKVIVRNEIGNHDDHSSQMLAACLAMFYSNNPRVTIDRSPAPFFYYRYGKNLIATTHGNQAKVPQLPAIMANDRAEDWGDTEYRQWYTGHVHHDSLKEFPGVIVETFRTLASADAWHWASGYRSGQDMKCDVWHREFGKTARNIIGIQQIRRNQNEGS